MRGYTTAEILDALRLEYKKELAHSVKFGFDEDAVEQSMMIRELERLIERDTPGYLKEQEQNRIDIENKKIEQMYHL